MRFTSVELSISCVLLRRTLVKSTTQKPCPDIKYPCTRGILGRWTLVRPRSLRSSGYHLPRRDPGPRSGTQDCHLRLRRDSRLRPRTTVSTATEHPEGKWALPRPCHGSYLFEHRLFLDVQGPVLKSVKSRLGGRERGEGLTPPGPSEDPRLVPRAVQGPEL